MSVSLIAIDGVLRKAVGGALIPEGRRLYESLAFTGQVVLLYDAREREQTADWLELHGCNRHAFTDFADGATRLYLANRLRRQGYDIDLVVEPDPLMAQEMIKAGYNTLLVTHAKYTQPGWRPDADTGVRAWSSIVDETAKLAKMKAEDARLRGDE
jgi:hypothetical protein